MVVNRLADFWNQVPQRNFRVDQAHQTTAAAATEAPRTLLKLDSRSVDNDLITIQTQRPNELLSLLLSSIYGTKEGNRLLQELFIYDPVELTDDKEAKDIIQTLQSMKNSNSAITADSLPIFQTLGVELLYFATHRDCLNTLLVKHGLEENITNIGHQSLLKLATYIKAALDQLKK